MGKRCNGLPDTPLVVIEGIVLQTSTPNSSFERLMAWCAGPNNAITALPTESVPQRYGLPLLFIFTTEQLTPIPEMIGRCDGVSDPNIGRSLSRVQDVMTAAMNME